MDESELEAIASLSDDELVRLTESREPDAAESASSELYNRQHPNVIAIARRRFTDATDDYLRGSALSKLLRLGSPEAWRLAEDVTPTASPQVVTRIAEEMATTDDPDVFARSSLIARVRARLADLPVIERSTADLFRRRFG